MNASKPQPLTHISLPITPYFFLFSCPLLSSLFVFLSMISICWGHVLQVARSVIHSVIFHLTVCGVFFLTLPFPFVFYIFWGFNIFFSHFLLSFVFPPSLSVCAPWCHCVLDVPRCGQSNLCEYHMIKCPPLPQSRQLCHLSLYLVRKHWKQIVTDTKPSGDDGFLQSGCHADIPKNKYFFPPRFEGVIFHTHTRAMERCSIKVYPKLKAWGWFLWMLAPSFYVIT